MEEIGFDMSSQYSKPLTLYLGKVHFGYLITVCSNAEQQCPIFPAWEYGSIGLLKTRPN